MVEIFYSNLFMDVSNLPTKLVKHATKIDHPTLVRCSLTVNPLGHP